MAYRELTIALLLIASHAAGLVQAQHPQYRFTNGIVDDVDISNGKWAGLTTFANLPYTANCLQEKNDQLGDILVLGAPFDTGVSARPGARYGPNGIRQGSSRIGADFAWGIDGFNAFKSWATVLDCGDVPMTPFDNTIALAQLQKAHELILSRDARNKSISSVPRIITLGGDHTISLPAIRAAQKTFGKISVLHFDSHIDTWSPEVLPHPPTSSRYAGINHGTWGWHAWHEGLIADNNLHVGIRAPFSSPKTDLEIDKKCGFEIVTAKSIDKIGVQGIIDAIKTRLGHSLVYLSLDIDVVDPAYAPATGTPEPGGFTSREVLAILDGLEGLQIVGADVVEVAPAYDDAGQITSLLAASVVESVIGLMVKTPVILKRSVSRSM